MPIATHAFLQEASTLWGEPFADLDGPWPRRSGTGSRELIACSLTLNVAAHHVGKSLVNARQLRSIFDIALRVTL
jgi:hypothetical protein